MLWCCGSAGNVVQPRHERVKPDLLPAQPSRVHCSLLFRPRPTRTLLPIVHVQLFEWHGVLVGTSIFTS